MMAHELQNSKTNLCMYPGVIDIYMSILLKIENIILCVDGFKICINLQWRIFYPNLTQKKKQL